MNIDSAEYRKFLDICQLASDLKAQKDYVKLAVVEEAFRTRVWDWADGQTVVALIEGQLRLRSRYQQEHFTLAMHDMVDRTVASLWDTVASAAKAGKSKIADRREIDSLYPRIAVTKAISLGVSILRSVGWVFDL